MNCDGALEMRIKPQTKTKQWHFLMQMRLKRILFHKSKERRFLSFHLPYAYRLRHTNVENPLHVQYCFWVAVEPFNYGRFFENNCVGLQAPVDAKQKHTYLRLHFRLLLAHCTIDREVSKMTNVILKCIAIVCRLILCVCVWHRSDLFMFVKLLKITTITAICWLTVHFQSTI